MRSIEKYGIYRYIFPKDGDMFFTGPRRVMVIQNDMLNKASPTVLVAVIIEGGNVRYLPTHVPLGEIVEGDGEYMAILEHICTVRKDALGDMLGKVEDKGLIEKIAGGLEWVFPHIRPLKERDEKNVRCLCSKCVGEYFSLNSYHVKRVELINPVKRACDKCGRPGFEFYIEDRKSFRSAQTGS